MIKDRSSLAIVHKTSITILLGSHIVCFLRAIASIIKQQSFLIASLLTSLAKAVNSSLKNLVHS
jgi:hypothetical protein